MDTRELIERLRHRIDGTSVWRTAGPDEDLQAMEAAVSSQAAEIERLTRERDDALLDRDKFCAIAQDKLEDTRLVSAGPNGGGFGFNLAGGPIPYIAEYLFQFIGARDEKGPSNYAEIEVQHNTFGAMTLTLQRRSGQTPHQLRASAVAEAKALREALDKAAELCDDMVGEGGPLFAGVADRIRALTPKPNKEGE